MRLTYNISSTFNLFYKQDLEETLGERLMGLTEMFPESVRNATNMLYNGTCSAVSFAFKSSRSVLWIASSSFVILLLPYVFEKERTDYEEKMRQEERNVGLLLFVRNLFFLPSFYLCVIFQILFGGGQTQHPTGFGPPPTQR